MLTKNLKANRNEKILYKVGINQKQTSRGFKTLEV